MFDDFVNKKNKNCVLSVLFLFFIFMEYHCYDFYKNKGVSISVLLRQLGDMFPMDIKFCFKTANLSENLYSESSVLTAVSMVCGESVKTVEQAAEKMKSFIKEKNREVASRRALERYREKRKGKFVPRRQKPLKRAIFPSGNKIVDL